jgi:hypothetical protein
MRIYASIECRRVRIVGRPHSVWRAGSEFDPEAQETFFRFVVTDDGGDNFLLVCESLDGSYCADTWHATFADAVATAEAQFGVRPDEWSMSPLA